MNRIHATSKRKKKRIKQAKPCPFPVPIESITGVPVSDKQWMYFTGYIHGQIVAVRHSGDMDYLYKMGFFGKGNLSRGEPEYNSQYRYTTIVSDDLETYPRIVNKQWYKNHLSWVKGRVDSSSEEESDTNENLQCSDREVSDVVHPVQKGVKTDDIWKEEVNDPWESTGGDGLVSDSLENKADVVWNEEVKDPWENSGRDFQISDSIEKVHKANDFWNDKAHDPWEGTGSDVNFWNTENDNEIKNLTGSLNIDTTYKTNKMEISTTYSESAKTILKCDEQNKVDNYSGSDSNISMKELTENCSPPLKKLKVEAEPVISKQCFNSCKAVYHPLCIQNEKTGDLFVIPNENYDRNIKRKTRKWRPIMKMNPFPIKEYLQLSFVEAFFLCYGLGCLIVKDSERNVDIKSLWKLFCTKQRNFIPSYVCYHYFRSKGWVPKSGLKFGCDYILYKVGPPFYHGSYSVIIQYVEEGSLKPVPGFYQRKLSWRSLCGLNRITEHVGKEVLICYVIKPKRIPDESFSSDYISQFKVKEILLSRWVSSQERQNKETEDIP